MKQLNTFSIFLLVAFLFTIQTVKAQETPEWARVAEFGIHKGYAVGVGVFDFEMDSQGNCYLTGGYGGTLAGDGFLTESVPEGMGNSFLIKYDINGNYLWHIDISVDETIPSTFYDKDLSYALVVDENDNVYITGRYVKSLNFGNDITLSTGLEQSTMFVARINANGVTEWAKGITPGAGADYSEGNDITIDQEGNVLVVGCFDETISFDGGTNSITACQGGTDQEDVFIAKYNQNNGDFVSVIQGGGANDEYAFGITTDSDNNYYIFGKFQNFAVFGDITINETPGGNYDRYIAKCTPEGVFTEAITIGSTGIYGIGTYNSIDCDNNNNIYIADEAVKGDIYFDDNNIVNSSYDHRFGYFAKYNANLEFQWGELIECNYGGDSKPASATSFKLDQNGNAYLVGYYQKEIDFGNNISLADEFWEYNAKSSFIVKYGISGNEPIALWADQAVNNDPNAGGNEGLFIDIYNDNYFFTGLFAAYSVNMGDIVMYREQETFATKIFIATDYQIAPTILSATVLEDGLTIEVTFDKEMTLGNQTAPAGFSINVEYPNKEDNPIVYFQIKEGEPETMVYYLTNTIPENNDVFLNYTPGTIESLDKGELEIITDYPVINNSTVTSISKINNQFTIYPNPSNGIFTIDLHSSAGQCSVLITNITGKTIYNSIINSKSSIVNLKNQPKGVYFINIQTETGIYIQKLIIQ